MHVLNKITVIPRLPERIKSLSEIANNLWWSWNTEFLKLFKEIDLDLWEKVERNPIKFLALISQEKLNEIIQNQDFLKKYDDIQNNFKNYMSSENTWFDKKYNHKNDKIAYFSAEYGFDEILQIYSGGLGILSGDHLKSASDLGIPLVAVGMLYKNGYFHQQINEKGEQETILKKFDLSKLPIKEVKNQNGENVTIQIELPQEQIHLKIWQVNVGRVKLYLLDSDVEQNTQEYREITSTLYGGNQETRILQEIILGIGGKKALKHLKIEPTIYHMNEGHSSFLLLELIKEIMQEKEVSFTIAKDIVSSKTVFTTHTPVPAGNDIFPSDLVNKFFGNYPEQFGITQEEFFKLGMASNAEVASTGFNMGILALKISGKKNGVSKLHGEVSRELFSEIWPNISKKEAPITYVTNGIHTCTWLAPSIKELYNKYLMPYWQDEIYNDSVWKNIKNIPDEKLWNEHLVRKMKLITKVKDNVVTRMKRNGSTYEEIASVISGLNANTLTIGFARRFATYKRATLIFKDLERIKQIVNDTNRPIQIIFAGKAHPADEPGKNLIKYINELSMQPEFKGKVFLLEDYSMEMSRYLISGVDIWLNTPRRPMEASGTSGQKAAVNGVINFSVLDGWWAEGYNTRNGWKIGTNDEYVDDEVQDRNDSESLYNMLEKRIIPAYYNRNEKGIPKEWVNIMKETIISNSGRFSTSRMLVDYMEKLYMPLINLTNKYYKKLDNVTEFNKWKKNIFNEWDKIEILQSEDNINNKVINAGDSINVKCKVKLPHLLEKNIKIEVFYGKFGQNGIEEEITSVQMNLCESDLKNRIYTYTANMKLEAGGEFAYTFRAMPKHEMLLDSENLNLIKWM